MVAELWVYAGVKKVAMGVCASCGNGDGGCQRSREEEDAEVDGHVVGDVGGSWAGGDAVARG